MEVYMWVYESGWPDRMPEVSATSTGKSLCCCKAWNGRPSNQNQPGKRGTSVSACHRHRTTAPGWPRASILGLIVLGGMYYLLMKSVGQAIYILFDIAGNTRMVREAVEMSQAQGG